MKTKAIKMTQAGSANIRTTVAVGVTLVLAVIITILTLMPMPEGGPPGSDKLYHVVAFAVLAVPLSMAVPGLAVWVFLGTIAYGGVIELVQPSFHRMGEWADWRADAVGAIVGVLIGVAMGRILFRPHQS